MLQNSSKLIQKVLSALFYTVFLAVFPRHRHLEKVPVTGTEHQKTSPYQPNKDQHQHFVVPVLGQSVSISAGPMPGPVLCPGDRKKYCIKQSRQNLLLLN